MKKNTIFNALTLIDDDLIADAGKPAKKFIYKNFCKITAVAAAAAVILCLTVFAANIILGGRSSYSRNINYTSVPSAQTLQKDIDIYAKIPESFSNGYVFENGRIIENNDYDTNGNIFESYKSFSCDYKNDNDSISLYIDASIAGNQINGAEKISDFKGSEILYSSYTNKFLPPDYKLTAQDKEDEASGKYVFSYGASEIQISEVQNVYWTYNGLNYSFCVMDNDITKNELAKMAQEIIDFQNTDK